jgi:bacteriocin biosynthesis cyclodehydratase domain-containing protein
MQGSSAETESAESGLPRLPYLAPWYRLTRDDGRLVLSYAHSAIVLEGAAVAKLMPILLPLLDGRSTVEEIDQRLGAAAGPAVRNALRTLADRGVLTDGPPIAGAAPAPDAEAARLLAATVGNGLTEARGKAVLEGSHVSVIGGGITATEIDRLLRASGLEKLDRLDWDARGSGLEGVDLVIAAPEPSELLLLEQWNQTALGARQPWLSVLPFDGRIAAVGPLYVPGQTCCYECFRRRRAANLTMDERDYWALESAPAAYPSAPPLQSMAAGLAATLALRWIGERASGQTASSLPAAMHAIEWESGLEVHRHFVYRVPRCPACFDERGAPSPWHS